MAREIRWCSAEQAVRQIGRGKHIFIGSGAAEPALLVEALVVQADHFVENPIVHLLTLGEAPYVAPEYAENFRHNAFFIGANVREAVHAGRADYTPVFLHKIPSLMRQGRMPIHVALIQVSPPDPYGYVNLGVSVDIVLAAVAQADLVIAQVNRQMPVVFGAGFLRSDQIDLWVEGHRPLHQAPPQPLDEVAREIGRNCASLIEDGSTVQVGIGQIPDATLEALSDKNDLGVWTEMFSDGVLDLLDAGNITGRYKTVHPGKITSSFSFGSQRLYDALHHNPVFTFHPSDYVNDPIRIARQHKMVAINSALQIDLTGQVCADSMGTRFYSGIGGQVDFIRGASMCPDGKAIIAIRSTAKRGTISRIVSTLSPGAGVVTSRGDVRYVVTEHGIADLQGKSVRERAMALISIAHPDYQSELLAEAKERHYVFGDQVAPRAAYPKRFEATVRSRDRGELLLRPVRITDEAKLADLFFSLSQDTIYQRYQKVLKAIPHQQRQYYLDVDYQQNMVLVAETLEQHDQESQLVAVAQYVVDASSQQADVAFVVRDDWQGQGVGTKLLHHMVAVARASGVQALRAEVLVANAAMLHVFHKSGLNVFSKLHEGIYTLQMPLR